VEQTSLKTLPCHVKAIIHELCLSIRRAVVSCKETSHVDTQTTGHRCIYIRYASYFSRGI